MNEGLGWSGGYAGVNGWSSQDATVVIHDQEFEAAREHGLAVGEQHLPAERHNVAAETRGRGGAIANGLAQCAFSRRRKGELGKRGVSGRSTLAERVGRPERGNGGGALGRVRFVPGGDIKIGERLSVEHVSLHFEDRGRRALSLAAGSRCSGQQSMTWQVKKRRRGRFPLDLGGHGAARRPALSLSP